jgi:hypothetical protein
MPDVNPNFHGNPRTGKIGSGLTAATLGTVPYFTGYIPVTSPGAGLGSTARNGSTPEVDVPCPSVITLKPATCGHFKTGHFGWPET